MKDYPYTMENGNCKEVKDDAVVIMSANNHLLCKRRLVKSSYKNQDDYGNSYLHVHIRAIRGLAIIATTRHF